MWNKCKVELLPSKEFSNVQLDFSEKLHLEDGSSIALKEYKHIYITSEEVVNSNDWAYNVLSKTVVQFTEDFIAYYAPMKDFPMGNYKKIVASTDDLLKFLGKSTHGTSTSDVYSKFPKIPTRFIERYVREYNKGNIITVVLVEFTYDNPEPYKNVLQLKVNPEDNTINIKPIKESWSKEELVEILGDFFNDHTNCQNTNIPKWIEENL